MSTIRNRRIKLFATLSCTMTFVAVGWFCLFYDRTDFTEYQKATECRSYISHLGGIFAEFVLKNNDIPRDDLNRFCPERLLVSDSSSRFLPLGKNTACCAQSSPDTTDHWSGLKWHSNWTTANTTECIASLKERQRVGLPFIVLCRQPSSLNRIGRRRYQTVLLLSDGRAMSFSVSLDQYSNWFNEEFLQDKPDIPEFMKKQIPERLQY